MRRPRFLVLTQLVILSLVVSFPRAHAETLSGAIYSGAYRAVAGDSCNSTAKSSDPACSGSQGLVVAATAQLSEIGQTKVYQDLAALQNDRVQCGIKKQQSLTNSPEAMKAAKDRINRALPVLSALKKQVGALVAQWQVLRGSIPQDKIWIPDPYAAKRKQADDLNTLAKTLTADYERQLAALLQTEDVGNREFIEDHMASALVGVKLLSDSDFKDLQKKVSDHLSESSRNLTAGASNFSNKLRNSLAQDADLIGVYLNKNPDSRVGVERLQCVAHQRVAGEQGLDVAMTVGSFAIPGGALALARAARIAYVAKLPRVANAMTKVGKGFGYTAMALGSVQTAIQIHESCTPPDRNDATKGSSGTCTVSAESILAEESMTECVSSGLWSASPILGKFAVGLLAKTSRDLQHEKDLAKFIEDHKGDRRKRDLASVDRLLTKDDDRVRATEAILGRAKPFSQKERDGFIAAHNVGKAPYTPAEIEEKKRLLTEAGFGYRERTIMLHKGLAGRFAGLSDDARTAEIKAYDKLNLQNVKDWAEHWNVGAQMELIRDTPDPEKFRRLMSKTIEARMEKYWRAPDRAKLPNELIKGMSDDFALLGSVSRGNPKLFAMARQNYIDTVKIKMRKIEKEGGDAKAWLKTELASKKAGGAIGPAGEMQKFESEMLSDVTAMIEKDPKFVNVTLDQTSFQKSKIEAVLEEAKSDVAKAVNEGPPTVVANQAGVIDGASAAAAPKPPPGSTYKPYEFEKPADFARRQKLASEYESWSGGRELSDAQSKYLSFGHLQRTDSSGYGGITKMRELGFDTREARLLQLNGFEVGVNKKFAAKPIPDDVIKKTLSNFVDEPAFQAPVGISQAEAAKIVANSRNRVREALSDTKSMATKLDGVASEAKSVADLDNAIAGRNANALYCRKLINVLMAAEPNSSEMKTWKEMVTTGPCRY